MSAFLCRSIFLCTLAAGAHVSVLGLDSASETVDPCRHFFDVLSAVPNESLSRQRGIHQSLWDGQEYEGCEVRFATDDTLLDGRSVPAFEASADSKLFRRGWRPVRSIGADGPGSGMSAMERGRVRCLVHWAQPAYFSDSGRLIQSATLSMTIQCGNK